MNVSTKVLFKEGKKKYIPIVKGVVEITVHMY